MNKNTFNHKAFIGLVQGESQENYYIRDFTNDVEKIRRSDIINEEQDEDVQLQVIKKITLFFFLVLYKYFVPDKGFCNSSSSGP